MVMIVPVDGNVDKTQKVTQKLRRQRRKRTPCRFARRMKLKNHNGDDDGKNAIAKRLESVLGPGDGFERPRLAEQLFC